MFQLNFSFKNDHTSMSVNKLAHIHCTIDYLFVISDAELLYVNYLNAVLYYISDPHGTMKFLSRLTVA